MENFDDLFQSVPAKGARRETDEFDKDAWAAQKQAEREAVYEMIDDTLSLMGRNGQVFQSYLDVQARFDRYSPNNAALIAAQMPEATRLADFNTWKKEGLYVRRNEEAVKILEPGKEYERDDGTIGISYDVKRVFDVSQTNSRKKTEPVTKRDDRLLLKALMNNAPCNMEMSDTLPENVNARYDPEKDTVLLRSGLDAPALFRGLAQGIARAFVEKDYPDCIHAGFSAYCVSYMLCKRNGVSADAFSFDRLPDAFSTLEPQELRAQLDIIREISGEISMDMYRVFAAQDKAQKQRDDGAR